MKRAAAEPARKFGVQPDGSFVPCVIKYDGLADGKGVFVCKTVEEAEHAFDAIDELIRKKAVSMYDKLETYATLGVDHEDQPVVRVELWYPRADLDPRRPCAVEVGLVDVRAADSIRIEYDFDRDGWSVKQASRFEWPADDKVCDPDWQEVAFVGAESGL